jgi:hypothetical protein
MAIERITIPTPDMGLKLPQTPPDVLAEALREIEADSTLFPVFGVPNMTTTRIQIFEQVFGEKARKGEDRTYSDGEKRHYPGYYDKYPYLTPYQIDQILGEYIVKLSVSKIITSMCGVVENALNNANKRAQELSRPNRLLQTNGL